MSFRSILVSLRSVPPLPRARAAGRRAGFRPRLEPLEDRSVPATFTVLNLADGGAGSLRQAVLDANALAGADTIDFADGLLGTIGLTTGQLSITDHLTIDGPGADLLAVSGNGQSRVFRISGGLTVAIDDLRITDGRAVGDGGGILNTGSTLALDRVVLSNNQAVGAPGGTGRGGAIANMSGASLTVTDSLFTQNQAIGGTGGSQAFGGGILNLGSGLTVSRSTFIGNQAIGGTGSGPARGGGIDTANGLTVTITDCTFIGNQALAGDGSGGNGFGRGGGLYNTVGTVTVENSTFLGNLARGGSDTTRSGTILALAGGGALFNADRGTLFLIGSTVTGNQALAGSNNTSTGGSGFVGSAFGGGLNNVGRATITDTLFEDNEARGGSGNRGDGTSSLLVGVATGGAIATASQNTSGESASMTLSNVTLRHNRAIGGDGNTAGTFVNAGIGGGLGNSGSNPFLAVSNGSEVTLRDSTVVHNQAIGGRAGAALGGGVANNLGGVLTVSGSTLAHNQAQGGDGGTAADAGQGFGGGLYNGAASNHPSNLGALTVLVVEGSTIAHNKAQGGAAVTGGSSAGDGLGGGLWSGGVAFLLDTVISHNHALGGDGADGSDGGNGHGGGVYNETTSSLRLERSTVTNNHANGGDGGAGGSDGEGVGGGVYNLGLFDFDALTLIFKNHASTSHDDVFDIEM
jgi:hypothetical protein